MSSYSKVPTGTRSDDYYTESSMKNAYCYGQCDSGISDVFYSSPMEAELDGPPTSNNHSRPKLMVQGSLEDVENEDSGIMMMGEDAQKDSARSSQTESFTPMDVDSRTRSNSPKSMSDSETFKMVMSDHQESRVSSSRSKRHPRLPKKSMQSSVSTTVSNTRPSVSSRIVGRSASANTLSSTPELDRSTTTTTSQQRHQKLSIASSSSTNALAYMYTAAATTTDNQRVPPLPSVGIQHLRQYMSLFIPDKEGDTGFHLAVIHSQPDVLDRLLYIMSKDRSLQPAINEQNGLYQTALHLATHTQQLEMMRKLLIAGASIDVTDHKGNTPLHIAARFRSPRPLEEIARYISLQTILEVAQVRNNEGQTCVHVAAKNGNTELLGKLKSLGVDVDMQDLNCGKTALHLVAEKSSLTDVQFLIETCEADVNCVTYSGCSALHIAAGRGDIAIVAYLISMGADPELLTDEGDLALDLSGSEQVMSFLTRVSSLKWLY